jgi:superfamily II DNA/RNA helicase
MMELSQVYTVEYSAEQNCFHIDTLDRVLSINLRQVMQGRMNDYKLIAVAPTRDAAHQIVRTTREYVAEQQRNAAA